MTASVTHKQSRRCRSRRDRMARIVDALLDGRAVTPAEHCAVCERELRAETSVERGIGVRCWREVLRALRRAEVRHE